MRAPQSKKPGKQRSWRYNAPQHARRKMMSSTLSPELRKKYNRRNMTVKKGDTVKIMRGDFKGASGEVMRASLKDLRIYVEGVTVKKADGTDVEKAVDPSNVQITDLVVEDKKRKKILERSIGEVEK